MLDDLTRLQHMLDSAREALVFARGRTRVDLDQDRMLALSLVKAIEIMGEAANHVSRDTCSRYPAFPWRQLVGMRNRTILAYIDIDYDIVWATVQVDLPVLVRQLEVIISDVQPS